MTAEATMNFWTWLDRNGWGVLIALAIVATAASDIYRDYAKTHTTPCVCPQAQDGGAP